mgnify:CR=1 FL=1
MSIIKHASSFAGRLARTVCGAALGLGLVVAAVPDLALAQDTPPAGPALSVLRDADSTLYLFGTVHLLRPGGGWMTPQVADAFDASEELWLEIEDPTDQAAAAPLIMQHGLSPQTPLSSRLNAEELASLDAAVAAMGATRQMLDPMRPWLAALTLSRRRGRCGAASARGGVRQAGSRAGDDRIAADVFRRYGAGGRTRLPALDPGEL